MTTKPAKAPRPVVDLTDLTLDQLDEAQRLIDKDGIGRTTAFAYVGLRAQGRELTLDQAKALTMRDVSIVETDPDEADDDTPTNGR